MDMDLFDARITELWTGPEGPAHTVSLITTAPNEVMREIHDRMPVIVPAEDYAAWLDPGNVDAAGLKEFIRPYPTEKMRAHPVNTRVNAPKNDDEELIAPISA